MGLPFLSKSPEDKMMEFQAQQNAMQINAQQYPSGLDPLAAAQIGRQLSDADQHLGVANITLESKSDIDQFRARLRGYETRRKINPDGSEGDVERIKFGEPMLNDEGVNHLCAILENVLSKNRVLSHIPENLAEQRIAKRCLLWWRVIALQLMANKKNWQVDTKRWDDIPATIVTFMEDSMWRAYGDGERRKLYPTQKSLTTTMMHQGNGTTQPTRLLGF